ncbi:MAG: OB-fold domain-containing protein [Deltaproteobacteria bacterium]|nr:OB-fold domain-containing protein [Deltaproteobacteria bacterium]
MSDPRLKPIPSPDEITRPFWEAAREQRLVIQRCTTCNYYNHPPRTVCDSCLSQELCFEPVSGRGRIHTFTVMHQRDVPGFESEAPFINIVVELEEQPMLLMVSNLPISERERVHIGGPVMVEFEDRDDGVIVPQFRIL